MIHSAIIDPSTELVSQVKKKRDVQGAVSLTEPLYNFHVHTEPLVNPDFGVDMNQNAAFGGTPLGVHNGTDSSLWTGSEISGTKVTFDSTDQANSGTKSVKVDNPAVGNVWAFTNPGGDITVSAYNAVTLFMYVDKDWSSGESVTIYGFDTGLGAQVGVAIAMEDFFDELSFDIWQKLAIPLAAMGLTGGTIDSFRMEMAVQNGGKNPKFYIDDFQLEQTGAVSTFSYKPQHDDIEELTSATVSFVDNVTEAQAADYSAILGLGTLPTGINMLILSGEDVIMNKSVTGLISFIEMPNATITIDGDGTNSWVVIRIDFSKRPILLHKNDVDGVFFTISDDLEPLIHFKTFLEIVTKI